MRECDNFRIPIYSTIITYIYSIYISGAVIFFISSYKGNLSYQMIIISYIILSIAIFILAISILQAKKNQIIWNTIAIIIHVIFFLYVILASLMPFYIYGITDKTGIISVGIFIILAPLPIIGLKDVRTVRGVAVQIKPVPDG